MNKLKLIASLLLSGILIQSCKKDTVTAIAGTTKAFQAVVDGTTWAPDTVSTTITYNAGTKDKEFTCTGTKDQKQVIMTITLKNVDSGDGFATGTYNVDEAGTVKMQFNTQQKNESGQYVFLPSGTVSPGSGTIIITAVDSVKKTITGSFSFYSRTTNYDTDGNVISISVHNITAGVFTSLAYSNTPVI